MLHLDHFAHIYRDDPAMAKAVGEWIAPALRRGAGAVMVCTPDHARLIRQELQALGVDAETAAAAGRLAIVDADALLGRFMAGARPDAERFHDLVGSLLVSVASAGGGRPSRAWGEMVDILSKRGEHEAAAQLEALWNEILARHDVQLLCSYDAATLPDAARDAVRAAHSDVVVQTQ